MKVDLLHYSAPPVVGGVESVIAHHARLMTDAGHSVRIIAGRGAEFDSRTPFVSLPLADSRHPDILRAKHELDQGRVPQSFQALKDQIYTALKQIITDSDVLIAHNVCSLHKNLALTAAVHQLCLEGIPPRIILWHHDLAWTTPRYRSELFEGYPWDLLRTDWPPATQVVVSELRRTELSALLNVPTRRIVVVPNGLDIQQFLKLENQTLEFVAQLDLLTANPLFLLPVRITPRKNIELALSVLAELKSGLPAARLVVTGPLGPHNPANIDYYNELLALRTRMNLQDAAYFLAEFSDEYLPDTVISDLYRLSDALFFPSREEGFGIPILEAGISGLPIFCTDIQPLRDLAEQNAIYFSPEADPHQVARLIRNYFSADTVHLLKSTVKTKFSWQRIYQNLIEPLLE